MWLFLGIMFVFGLIIGSFLNCLIWRLYSEETVLGRSYCPKCRHQLSWYDNIPLLSFLFLGGKCRYCSKSISWQYPLVEFFIGLFFALAFFLNTLSGFSTIKLIFDLFLISVLLIIFIFDLRWMLVPTKTIWISAIILVFLNLFLGFSLWQMFLTTLAGVSFFALQYFITKGKGLGEGDIWIGGLLGVAFPAWPGFILTLFLTYLIGGFVATILLVFNLKKLGSKLPLGVFLTLGALISLFFGDNIISWFFQAV